MLPMDENEMDNTSEFDDQMSEDINDTDMPGGSSSGVGKKVKNDSKRYKKGIVYLSFIPPGMNVQIVTHMLSKYGELGRVMLQPAKSANNAKKRKTKQQIFTEGWVEFLKKKTAKQVAASLNNRQMGGKKKSKFHDYIWNIKYLPRFKWVHLSERMAYEKAVYKQRMQTEITQAKKVASHFIDKVQAAEKQEQIVHRKKKNNQEEEKESGEKNWQLSMFFKQKETDQEKVAKQNKKKKNKSRENFLKNLFS